jgi:hypothetical protein
MEVAATMRLLDGTGTAFVGYPAAQGGPTAYPEGGPRRWTRVTNP